MTVKQRIFSNQGDVTLRIIIRSRQFLNSSEISSMSLLICKFHEDPIKTEQVMRMTKSNRGFFSNHGHVTLGIIILSSQFSNSSEISSMSILTASFKMI